MDKQSYANPLEVVSKGRKVESHYDGGGKIIKPFIELYETPFLIGERFKDCYAILLDEPGLNFVRSDEFSQITHRYSFWAARKKEMKIVRAPVFVLKEDLQEILSSIE